jgi:hypothetical protein
MTRQELIKQYEELRLSMYEIEIEALKKQMEIEEKEKLLETEKNYFKDIYTLRYSEIEEAIDKVNELINQ